MKFKFSIAILCGLLLLSILKLPLHTKHHQPNPKPLQSVTNKIVAPAIVDALADITKIAIPQAGVVKKIYVKVGDKVHKGDALLALDESLIANSLQMDNLRLQDAQNALKIQQAVVLFSEQQLARLQSLDRRAISQVALKDKSFAVQLEKLKLQQVSQQVALAAANLTNTKLIFEQFVLRAPQAGVILQINPHKHEFVGGGQPLFFLGAADKVMVRVSIDERDILRFQADAPAYLTSTENPEVRIALTFKELKRYISIAERLNSRVQEVVYYFKRDASPHLIAGQQFDAHIEIKSSA